jgi:hypothetical protein
MIGILPELVRQRDSKAEFSNVFEDAQQGLGGLLEGRLACEERGWVDSEAVRRTKRWSLWMVAGMEMWLRNLKRRQHERTGSQQVQV